MNVRRTSWVTRSGKRRRIRLYLSWRNIHNRVAGHHVCGKTGEPLWLGLDVEFRDWQHFRDWAIENGYSRANNSLDRIDPQQGYTPDNCRWISVGDNSLRGLRTAQGNRITDTNGNEW